MTDPRADHFRAMLAYERKATAQVAQSLASVPEAKRSDPACAKARSIFAHTQQATHLWLSRVGGIPPRPFVMFPDWSVEQTLADAGEVHDGWERFLGSLAPDDLSRAVVYTSTEGAGYRSTVSEILTHVFNHATYHRGQIALLVSGLGGQRAVTDFIAFTRTKI